MSAVERAMPRSGALEGFRAVKFNELVGTFE